MNGNATSLNQSLHQQLHSNSLASASHLMGNSTTANHLGNVVNSLNNNNDPTSSSSSSSSSSASMQSNNSNSQSSSLTAAAVAAAAAASNPAHHLNGLMYKPAAGLIGFAHSFSISSLMNAAAAASADANKFDINSYSQMYQQQANQMPLGALGGGVGVVQGGLVVPSGAGAAGSADYYQMYNQPHGL